MGIMHIPYNRQADPNALFSQGMQNLVAGLIEANQAKIEGQEMRRLTDVLPENHPLRVAFSQGPIRSPRLRQAFIGGLGQSFLNPYATQQARANLRYTKARTKAFKRGKNTIKDLMTEGYSAEEAKHIRDISHGLKPRASATKSLEQKPLAEQLSFWQTVYNKTLDPEWGTMSPTEDMNAARELAKQNMDRITTEMRQSTQADTSDLDLETDLENAMSAIENGAPPEQVYQRLIQTYPDSAAEIRRQLGL